MLPNPINGSIKHNKLKIKGLTTNLSYILFVHKIVLSNSLTSLSLLQSKNTKKGIKPTCVKFNTLVFWKIKGIKFYDNGYANY